MVNNAPALMNVIKAIAHHAESLALVFLMFLFSVIIFVSFGLTHLPEAFERAQGSAYRFANGNETMLLPEPTDTVKFKSVISGFWYFLHALSQRGNIASSLAPVQYKSSQWLPRVFFDTSFFIWVRSTKKACNSSTMTILAPIALLRRECYVYYLFTSRGNLHCS